MNSRSKDWNDSKDQAKGKVSMFICFSPHALQAADLVGTTHPSARPRPIPIRHNPNSRHRACFFPADRAFARWAAPPRYSDRLLLEEIAVWTVGKGDDDQPTLKCWHIIVVGMEHSFRGTNSAPCCCSSLQDVG